MLTFILAAASFIEVGKDLVLPIILALIAKSNWDGRKARKKAEEAADCATQAVIYVKPNGTGHATLTDMVEDILVGQGRVLEKIDTLDEKLDKHINEPFHPGAKEAIEKLNNL